MKYKVGDKVRIVSAWPKDGSACQNNEGKMDKWLGKVMTVRKVTSRFYTMEEDREEWFDGWMWYPAAIEGLATEPVPKYKVGDRVIIEESNIESVAHHKGLVGVIEKVWHTPGGHDYWVMPEKKGVGAAWCRVRCLAPSKIVVTTDGQTTTAKMFSGKELVKSAEAKCSPSDTFNFETGAAIALDRLLDREEKAELVKPVNPFKVGDYVRVTSQTRLGHRLPIGSVGRVTCIATCDSCLVDGFFVNGDRIDQYVPTCDLIKV